MTIQKQQKKSTKVDTTFPSHHPNVSVLLSNISFLAILLFVIQLNVLKWRALEPHHQHPLRCTIHLSRSCMKVMAAIWCNDCRPAWSTNNDTHGGPDAGSGLLRLEDGSGS